MSEETKPQGDEPTRKKKPKSPNKLTVKEKKFVEARLQGKDLRGAAIEAGYSPFRQTAYKVEKQIMEKAPATFNRIGLTVELLGRKILSLLDAKEDKHFANKGIVLETKTVEALDIQARATDMGLRAHGVYKQGEDVSDSVRFETGSVCVVVANERAAAALAGILSPRGTAGVVIDVAAEVHENAG